MARKPLKHYHVTVRELAGPIDYTEPHRSLRSAEMGMQAKVDQMTGVKEYFRIDGSMRSGRYLLYETRTSAPTMVEIIPCEEPTCRDEAGAWMSLF